MADRKDVRQGNLGQMLLKTLETMGPLHGYGIARRIEQTSGDSLIVRYRTLYPALLKLEQEGYIDSEWGFSENNRRVRFYQLTSAGRKELEKEVREWRKATAIVARFVPPEEPS
jgi:transcriptional regulator